MIVLILNIYLYFSFKVLRKNIVSSKFDSKFWSLFLLNFILNIFNFWLMKYLYLGGFLFLHLILTIYFRKLLILIFYGFYDKIDFLNNREFMKYSYVDFNRSYIVLFFFIAIYIYPILYILYLILISMFNFNTTEKQYDEAILNRYDDCKIRLFLKGKKKIAFYKKFLLDPKINNKYKFHVGYFLENDKFHLNLIWGKDFKFCKSLHNKMYNNNYL